MIVCKPLCSNCVCRAWPQTLDVRLQEAAGHQLSHAEFLELILQDELLVRNERLIDRRVKAAAVPRTEAARRLRLVASIRRSTQEAGLRPGHLPLHPREPRTCCCIGPPGTGKSFLVQAIGYQAIKQGFVVLYRSIFDVVRDFLHDEALGGRGEGAGQVSQARPADHRRHGHEATCPKQSGEVPVRDHHAALRDPLAR